jgi:hypothetical protein
MTAEKAKLEPPPVGYSEEVEEELVERELVLKLARRGPLSRLEREGPRPSLRVEIELEPAPIIIATLFVNATEVAGEVEARPDPEAGLELEARPDVES